MFPLTRTVDTERSLEIAASAEAVWEWLCDPKDLVLFTLNFLHERARFDGTRLARGSRIFIEHDFGLFRQRRSARISALRPFVIGWGEFADDGYDYFPHNQRFRVEPLAANRCRIHNRVRGTFRFPAAPFLSSWYGILGPLALDDENRKIRSFVEDAR